MSRYMMFNKETLILISCMATVAKGTIDPMHTYTPLSTISQSIQTQVQTATLIQSLATATTPFTVSVQIPSQTNTIPFSATDLGNSGEIFQSAGIYQCTSSILYSGITSALIISSSNIIVDLNGQTIEFSGNRSQTVHGIIIAPGVKNITIKNGTLSNFSGAGIYAQATPDAPITNITLDSVVINGCFNGIMIANGNNLILSSCTTSANENPISSTYGISLKNCSAAQINTCNSSYNTNITDCCYGFFCSESKKIIFNNCTAFGNEAEENVIGFYLLSMNYNSYIKSCISNGNMSNKNEAFGFLLENTTLTFLEDSQAHCNYTCGTTISYGIRLTNSRLNFIKRNSIDYNNYGIYDDESLGSHTNIFTQNSAFHNTITDYIRPNSSPLNFIKIDQEYLQGALQAGSLSNISVRIGS